MSVQSLNLQTLIGFETQDLGNFMELYRNTYIIPFTQRHYEWTEKEIARLFNDFMEASPTEEDFHAMNTMVFSTENGKSIYDGQQRTISTALFIAAGIRAALERAIDEDSSLDIEEITEWADDTFTRYIARTNKKHPEKNQYKLKFASHDIQNYFYKLVSIPEHKPLPMSDNQTEYSRPNVVIDSLPEPKSAKKDSSLNRDMRNMYDNYYKLVELWKQHIQPNVADYDIEEDMDRIVASIVFLIVSVKQDTQAAKMFESLNNTGKSLAEIDVLKSLIEEQLGEESMKDEWSDLDDALDTEDRNKFLSSITTIILGKKSPSKGLLDSFIEHSPVNSFASAKVTLQMLEKMAVSYHEAMHPEQVVSDLELKIESSWMKSLKISQHIPLVTAMLYRKYDYSDIVSIIKSIQELYIKNSIIVDGRANQFTNTLAILAKKVYDNKINTEEIITSLQNEMKDDNTFRKDLIKGKYNNSTKKAAIKISLIRLAEKENGLKNESEFGVKKSLQIINYEHILPQQPKPNSNWESDFADEKERDVLIHMLGNATLLAEKPNKTLQNSDFEIKKNHYKKSKISETNILSVLDKWDKDQIIKRTDELADKIVKLYSHDFA